VAFWPTNRVAGLGQPLLQLGIKRDGLYYITMDGSPAATFCMFSASDAQGNIPFVTFGSGRDNDLVLNGGWFLPAAGRMPRFLLSPLAPSPRSLSFLRVGNRYPLY
jgi:hypothetical protein